MQKTYQARTGLTPEQDAAISANPEYLKLAKDAELNKELLGRNRYNDVKNFHITPEEAIGKVFKRVPGEEDNTAAKIQDELKTFLTAHPSAKEINMGPVLEQALVSAGINENIVFDNDLNLEGFQAKLAKAYEDYNAFNDSYFGVAAALKYKATDALAVYAGVGTAFWDKADTAYKAQIGADYSFTKDLVLTAEVNYTSDGGVSGADFGNGTGATFDDSWSGMLKLTRNW